MGLTEHHEVVQAGGPALAPGDEVVDVAAGGGSLAGGEDAGPVAGAYQVRKSHRGPVPGAADVQDGAAGGVGHQAPPGPAGGQGPGSRGRYRCVACPDPHLSDLYWCGGKRGDDLGGGLDGGGNRGEFRQTPPATAGQTSPTGGGQISPAAWGVCAVERLGRGGGAFARAGSTWIKTAGVVGALAVPRTTAPGIAVLEPVVFGCGAGAAASGIDAAGGAIFWQSQTNQAAQRNGDVDVDADAFWQRKVTGG